MCIEMLPHETAAINSGGAGGGGSGPGNTGSSTTVSTTIGNAAAGFIGIGKSATDVNATTTTTASSSAASSLPYPPPLAASAATAAGSGAAECISLLKLIEETLQYLTKVINYAPEESIACLRQLLKYLFARNYGNRQQQLHQKQQQQQQHLMQQQHYKHSKQGHYPAFIKSYFEAKSKELQCLSSIKDTDDGVGDKVVVTTTNVTSPTTTAQTTTSTQLQQPFKNHHFLMDVNNPGNGSGAGMVGKFSAVGGVRQDDYLLLGELFASCLDYNTWKSKYETELSKHIKLFEPLVMHCLTVSNSI